MKNITEIKTIAIIGSGMMGSSIAQVFAMAGYSTILFDVNQAALKKAKKLIENNLQSAVDKNKISEVSKKSILGKIKFSKTFTSLKAEVIIEAIVEKKEIKQELFQKLATINSSETIFATNTSSIPVTQIAFAVPYPERVVGMHFFNPAHIMKLVEVISGAVTASEVALTIKALAEKIGKTVVMAQDSPGFIVNRVARHFYVEGLKILEERITDIETIDALAESSGFKMGPFKLMDLIGVDTNFSVTSSMFEQFHFDSKFRPSRIQKKKIDAGHHGRKTKKGFYDYP